MSSRRSVGVTALGIALALGAGVACRKQPEKPQPKTFSEQAADITADNVTLREATAAVNEVVRAAADCTAARAAMPLAISKLDEAASRVKTQAGRVSLDALRTQIQRADQLCPG